jgi:hypothetical protein
VDDARLVDGVHGPRQRLEQLGRLPRRLRPGVDVLLEVTALDQLHDEVRPALVLTDLVDGHDVGVTELGDGQRLSAEAC